MTKLPTGTITFFLTDIAGSTRLWEEEPEAMAEAVARHDDLIQAGVVRYGGRILKNRGEGDSFFVVFERARDGIAAACDLQRAFYAEPWPTPRPLRVRVALHTGNAELRDGDYYGAAVNRCARLRSIAHGDQILISKTTHASISDAFPSEIAVHDWGEHRLKDLSEPEHVFQVLPSGLPNTLSSPKSEVLVHSKLPLKLNSFIGRASEINEIKQRLTEVQLLTLMGIGGCGKTRLSLQVAKDLEGQYPDGVCFVELGTLTEPGLVVQTVANTLDIRQDPPRAVGSRVHTHESTADTARDADGLLLQKLIHFFQAKRFLLILDNCEHVLAACAELAQALLQACPQLHILASSREGLGVPGEYIYAVPPLSPPDLDQLPSEPSEQIKALSDCEAIRLFVERAAVSQSGFELTPDNVLLLAQICHRLDGLPLAIELAAARVKVLSVAQIAKRLDDRFKLLAGGSRTALPHQQTLRAAMDWSFDLLSDQEKLLFQRLSVFAGRFTLEETEGICSGEGIELPEILDVLARLVDKSLVLAETHEDQIRYRLLDTVRQYSQTTLTLEALSALRNRHRDWYLDLALAAEHELQGPDQVAWLGRLERSHDNLRSALDWSFDQENVETGLKLCGALWWFWYVRGYWSEGRTWLEDALSRSNAGAVPLRAKVLNGSGALAMRLGDYEQAIRRLERSLELYRSIDDNQGMAYALNALGLVAHRRGENERSAVMLEESLSLFRALEDRRGIAYSLNVLGLIESRQGNHKSAAALCEECLALRRALDDKRGIALVLRLLGNIMLHQGEHKRAAELHQESLVIFKSLRDTWGIANALGNLAMVAHHQGNNLRAAELFGESLTMQNDVGEKSAVAACLEGLARVACAKGDMVRTAQLYGAAEALRQSIQAPMPAADFQGFERYIASARTKLGEKTFEAAQRRGCQRSMEEAIQYALNFS